MLDNILIAGTALFSMLIVLIFIWSLVWKGIALWKAARVGSKNWFVALLIINTLGILEMLYIFIFSKKEKPCVCHSCENKNLGPSSRESLKVEKSND